MGKDNPFPWMVEQREHTYNNFYMFHKINNNQLMTMAPTT